MTTYLIAKKQQPRLRYYESEGIVNEINYNLVESESVLNKVFFLMYDYERKEFHAVEGYKEYSIMPKCGSIRVVAVPGRVRKYSRDLSRKSLYEDPYSKINWADSEDKPEFRVTGYFDNASWNPRKYGIRFEEHDTYFIAKNQNDFSIVTKGYYHKNKAPLVFEILKPKLK